MSRFAPVPPSPRIAQASSADATSARLLETCLPTPRLPRTARKGHALSSLHVPDCLLIIPYLLYLAWLDSFTLRSLSFRIPIRSRLTDLCSSHPSFILVLLSWSPLVSPSHISRLALTVICLTTIHLDFASIQPITPLSPRRVGLSPAGPTSRFPRFSPPFVAHSTSLTVGLPAVHTSRLDI